MSATYHAKKVLIAKRMLAAIKDKPGMTRIEILEAIGEPTGCGAFEVLQRHRLAYHTHTSPATWHPTGRNPQ